MRMKIDPADTTPIYAQIVGQVNYAIASGSLAPGERLPAVRDLAVELTVNPNTVSRAYRQLQSDGVLEAVRGTGLSVAEGALTQCQAERMTLIRTRLRQVLLEARHSRLNGESLRTLIDQELAVIEQEEGEA